MNSCNPFRPVYRELSVVEKDRIEQIKNVAENLLSLIEGHNISEVKQDGRCISLARINLEEAIMWAVKGITA